MKVRFEKFHKTTERVRVDGGEAIETTCYAQEYDGHIVDLIQVGDKWLWRVDLGEWGPVDRGSESLHRIASHYALVIFC